MAADLQLPAAAKQAPPQASAKRTRIPRRLWLMAAILAAYWIFEFTIYSTEMAMFPRFITRMLVLLALLVVFLGWWLTNRHLLWRDRLMGLALLFAGTTAAALLADPSARMVVVMAGLPRVFTAWTVWLLVSQSWTLATRRTGAVFAAVLVLGYFTLVRWDGLDGAQRAKLSWRWTPTAEQEFLAAVKAVPASDDSKGATAVAEWTLQPGDWPDFRSDQRDGGLSGVEIRENWMEHPPQALWRQRVGPGWSSMIVVDRHLVTQEQRGNTETVVCYDAATGNEQWVHEDTVRFEEPLAGAGPRATPTFSRGKILTLGAKGKLNCLEAATGKPVWSRDLLQEAEANVPQWGLSVSPLVVDDLVIVFAGGKKDRSLAAYRLESGEPVWSRAAGDQSYSSPQLVILAGERQVLMHDDLGLHAVNPLTGEIIWEAPNGEGGGGMAMLQPHAISEHELLTELGSGIALLQVAPAANGWSMEARWSNTNLKPGFNDFVVHAGHIFGLDDGILCCLDVQSGRRLWKKGRFGHGQMLLVASPPRLLVVSEAGEVALLAANPEKYEEPVRFQAISGKTWNHPIVAHGCLFLRNGEEMACYQLSNATPQLAADR